MRLTALFLFAFAARIFAQVPDTIGTAPGATVSGVVFDSVARAPLSAAIVQLVAAQGSARFARSAVSDTAGRFSIESVPDGRFTIGFFHPMLDSLGLEAPLREVSVAGRRTVLADLAIPSPASIRGAVCGTAPTADSTALVVGFVRDPLQLAPVAGASVTAKWVEITFARGEISRRIPHASAVTGENGWFAICNLPSTGSAALLASRGADSTDLLEMQIPASGFLHRDLFLGPAESSTSSGSTVHTSGTGRLSGTVVAAVGGRPLPGAEVSLLNGPKTRAGESGDWTLLHAPLGSRMLEVRALGFYPVRQPVNVGESGAPLRVALSTLKAVLDTVRVNASRADNVDHGGFLLRSRSSGTGHFLTAEEFAKRQPTVTSDVFRTVPGLTLDRSQVGPPVIKMRGTFEDKCNPAIFIDGMYLPDSSADAIDDLVRPREVAGVEVYTGAGVPPQFEKGLSGCGSIVIWTKRGNR